MKLFSKLFLIVTLILLIGCKGQQEITLKLKNNTHLNLKDVLVEIPVSDLQQKYPGFNEKAVQLFKQDTQLAYQVDDRSGDGTDDILLFVIDMQPDEELNLRLITTQNVKIEQPFKKRTQAELSYKTGGKFENKKYIGGQFKNIQYVRVPEEHTDHDTYFRYEGPGWESDKVGYRFYLDWRNATDIFGKKTTEMVLQDVGQDGFDSYHEMADWGMDILKVGSSLGIGSIGMWYDDKVFMVSETDSVTCEIALNGPLYSMIRTNYYGWNVNENKYDLQSELSIAAGDRKTKHAIWISTEAENVCTGLVKAENVSVLESQSDVEWQYLATYGTQSLAGEEDNLGMAVLYRNPDLISKDEDDQSHILVLRPDEGKVTYYFLAAWQQEPGGIRDAEQFREYLEQEILILDKPVSVIISAL
jgi:hypothetical protein